jgi:hypothetical protein
MDGDIVALRRRPSPAGAGGVKVTDVEYPALSMGCGPIGFAAVT